MVNTRLDGVDSYAMMDAAWSLLDRIPYFAKTESQRLLLQHVISRTLRFGKVEELYRPSWVLTGKPSLGILGLEGKLSRMTLYRAQRELQSAGFLTLERPRGPHAPYVMRLELPVLARMMETLFSACEDMAGKFASLWRALRASAEALWKANGWGKGSTPHQKTSVPEDEMATIEENARAAREKSEAANARRQEKMKKADPEQVKPGWVFEMMRQFTSELGVRYIGTTLESKKDKGRLQGSARNFLAYCKEQDINPRDLLYDVCDHWNLFRSVLTDDKGRPIELSGAVNFDQFFVFRKQIVMWLAENKGKANIRTQRWEVKYVEASNG